jgi:flavodoxin
MKVTKGLKDFAQDVAESIADELDYDIAKEIFNKESSEDWEYSLEKQHKLRKCVYKWVEHHKEVLKCYFENMEAVE